MIASGASRTSVSVNRSMSIATALSVVLDVASDIGFPCDRLAAVNVFGALVRPTDAEGPRHFWMNRHLQPLQMIENGGWPKNLLDPQMAQQVLDQHREYLGIGMIGGVKQSLPLKIAQNILTYREAELLVHRGEAPFFKVVQPREIDHTRDVQRTIGSQTLFPIRDIFAQTGKQPVMIEEGQVGPFAFVGFLVARAVVMIERPQRRKVQERKFDDLNIVTNVRPERIVLPVSDVLNQQNIAVLEFGFAEFVQVLLQADEVIFSVQPAIEIPCTNQRLTYRLRLAISDDQHVAPPRSDRDRRRRPERPVLGGVLVQIYRAKGETGIARMDEAKIDHHFFAAFEAQLRRYREFDRSHPRGEFDRGKILTRQVRPMRCRRAEQAVPAPALLLPAAPGHDLHTQHRLGR